MIEPCSPAGAIASLLSGTLGTTLWKSFFEKDTGISERLTSFVFAFAMAAGFSLAFPEKPLRGASVRGDDGPRC